MSKFISTLGAVCAACNTERRKISLLYDVETFLPYCTNPYVCNDKHPNSAINLIKRKSEKLLIPYAKANEMYKDRLLNDFATPEMAEAIKKIILKPTLFRVLEPELAEFMVHLNKELKHEDMSTTIRHIIRCMKEQKNVYIEDVAKQAIVKEKADKLEAVINELQPSAKREDHPSAKTTNSPPVPPTIRNDVSTGRIRI